MQKKGREIREHAKNALNWNDMWKAPKSVRQSNGHVRQEPEEIKGKISGWKMEMQNEQSTELKTWENPAKTIPVPSAVARCKANWMI